MSLVRGSRIIDFERLLKSENTQTYKECMERWRARLEDAHKWAPEWVKARIRPVLAVLYL